jgi:hypothetical protein
MGVQLVEEGGCRVTSNKEQGWPRPDLFSESKSPAYRGGRIRRHPRPENTDADQSYS